VLRSTCDGVVNVIVGSFYVGDYGVPGDGVGIYVSYTVMSVDVIVVVDVVDAFVGMSVDGDDVSIYVIYVTTCVGDGSSQRT